MRLHFNEIYMEQKESKKFISIHKIPKKGHPYVPNLKAYYQEAHVRNVHGEKWK